MHDVLCAHALRVELGARPPHQRVLAVVRQGPANQVNINIRWSRNQDPDLNLLWPLFLVGWRDVPKRCVPVRIFLYPLSPKWSVPETQCPYIDKSRLFCINLYCIMHVDGDVSMQGLFVTRDDWFGDQGSQNIRAGTHRFGTFRQPTL